MNKPDSFELPFEKIESMRCSIPELKDLVAVLSQEEGDRLLFVYNDFEPSLVLREGDETSSLTELMDKNLSAFDGPLSGFSVLDVVRDDLLTKGPRFFPIEQFYRERNQGSLLIETMHRVSIFLVDHLSELTKHRSSETMRRAQAKIIQMALPFHLQKRECKNLVAVLPSHDLRDFVLNGDALFVYNEEENPHNLEGIRNIRINSDHNWIVALAEVSYFNSGIKPEDAKFLDLRELVRSAGRDDCLLQTCKHFAETFYVLASRDPHLLTVALSLMSEYWLALEDVDDLVAFCPHGDFSHFAKTGDALRVYRTLTRQSSAKSDRPGSRYSLEELLRHGIPDQYSGTLISLPIVSKRLQPDSHSELPELASVLSKSGHIRQLARTLWMMSYELSTKRLWLSQEFSFLPHYEELIDMAFRACMIYSLLDPWGWLHWQKDLRGNYQDLARMLNEAASTSSDSSRIYYEALQHWFAGWESIITQEELRSSLFVLHEFQRLQRSQVESETGTYAEYARRLIVVCENLLDQSGFELDVGGEGVEWIEPLKHRDVRRTLDLMACLSTDVGPISPLFIVAWLQLLTLSKHHEDLRSQERDAERLISQLQKLLNRLKQAQRLLFAPPHEYSILVFAYRQEIDRVEGHLRELESAAKLVVNLKNPWIDLHEEVDLKLEIANIGQVEANELEIRFASPRGYQPLDEKSIFEIPKLQPGASNQFTYRIRPELQEADIRLEYTFRDRRGLQHDNSWTTRLHVRNLDEAPYSLKVNRYQFGRPIQNPSDFYGRRSELQNILSHLRGGGQQNLLLRGPRRIGKTSMLYILQHLMLHPETRRLFDIPVKWDTELNRLRPVFLSLHEFDLRNGDGRITQFFYKLLDSAIKTLAIRPEEASHLLEVFDLRQSQVGAVNAALEQIGRIMDEHPDNQIVVLLDEYDEVYWPGSGGLDRGLREFVSAEQRLTWIISSTLALFEAVKSVSSPWFNIFAIVELQRLLPKAAVDLVEKPSQGEGVVWRSDAVLDLLDETGSHPAFTQLLCGRVIEYLNQTHTNYVVKDTIASIANQIVDEQETAHSHFEFYWSDTPGMGQLILLILDEQGIPLKRDEIRSRTLAYLEREFGERPHQRIRDSLGEVNEWWDRQFRISIDWADKITDAISPDNQHRFLFSVPLFRRWLHKRAQNEDLWDLARDRILKEMERDGLADS